MFPILIHYFLKKTRIHASFYMLARKAMIIPITIMVNEPLRADCAALGYRLINAKYRTIPTNQNRNPMIQ